MEEKRVIPKTLPGFMELLPGEQILFNQMREKIQKSYERFGFLPLDTPIIEYSQVLLAKAGGKTEKQIYRFQKGDNDISLRFDLTVPLAKYVSMNYHELTFPFKRYQIGKVFRGEKPQKGRYRELYQCDIDIIGDGELSNIHDAEIPCVIYTTFKELGFDYFTIYINNRKILNGFFEALNITKKSVEILRIIDKIDKIGKEKVEKELQELELSENIIESIMQFILIQGSNEQKIAKLKEMNIQNELYLSGVKELEEVLGYIEALGVPEEYYQVDLKIVRGLDYYTGTVYETFFNDYRSLGSICSGGRYDNLAEFYTDKKLPGVGISIGLTRLFYKLNEQNMIQVKKSSIADVLVVPVDVDVKEGLKIASILRENKINTDVFSSEKKMKAKLKYADKLKIPYVLLVGEEELNTKKFTLKNMETGEQIKDSLEKIIQKIKG